ncbi:MAG: DUF4369 domain-containing protein [Prevotella sp.]|nr:DUF4369 domain-containing protein [Prevotella sp.]
MKKALLFFASILIISCASNNTNKFVINGTVPSNKYDGEKVYLVPVINDNPSNVDSTIISNGKFTFKGDTERVSIIRLRPILRLKLQELLVITEKGIITVKLDTNSIGGGTPQNKLMQQWKDAIMNSNLYFAKMQKAKTKGKKGTDLENAINKANSAKEYADSITLRIIHSDKKSTISKFISSMTGKK